MKKRRYCLEKNTIGNLTPAALRVSLSLSQTEPYEFTDCR